MYLGKIMEICASNELYRKPLHPYTQALLSSIPMPDPRKNRDSKRIILQGDVKSPINPPEGCRFSSRCRYCEQICKEATPELLEIEKDHFVACHLVDKINQ
jgi:oligopeptide transport system ATP-binding protein